MRYLLLSSAFLFIVGVEAAAVESRCDPGPTLPVIVDRVEGQWVVLEVTPHRLVELPTDWFPNPPDEGRRLSLSLCAKEVY